jgi:3-oxoacid CoA-transferase subunit A
LAERIRAAGAGIGGFYTAAGVGTIIEEGKEKREINGTTYLFEYPLFADYAMIKAQQGDHYGNLIYRHTAQNFNPIMAKAAKTTIAEVEQLVEPSELDPNQIHTPSIYVHKILKGEYYEKLI